MRRYLFFLITLLMLSSTTYAQVMEDMPRQERARVIRNLISRMRPLPMGAAGDSRKQLIHAITPTPVTNYEWWAVTSKKLYTDPRQASAPAIVKNPHEMTNLLMYEMKRAMPFIIANAEQIKLGRQTAGLSGGTRSQGTGRNEEFFLMTTYEGWKQYTGKK